MAIGAGGQMALGAAYLSKAQDWYAAVLRSAGLDPEVHPITGRIEDIEWNGVVWSLDGLFTYDGKVSRPINGRVEAFLAARQREAERLGLKPEDMDGEVVWSVYILDGEGKFQAWLESRKAVVWAFYTHIGVLLEPKDFPPIPEGLHLPEWWPMGELAEWDARFAEEIQKQTEALYLEAGSLGIELCPRCGGYHKESWDRCSYEDSLQHPQRKLRYAQQALERFKEERAKAKAKAEAAERRTSEIAEEMASKGFFKGRRGVGKLPEDSVLIYSESMGARDDPIVLAAASKLTIHELKALVDAAGDGTEVVMEGRFPKLVSPRPARWIGKGGSTAKALASALGLKYLKVEELKR